VTLESRETDGSLGRPITVQFPDEFVFPDDVLRLDGVPITATIGKTVYALHKPDGVVTTMADLNGRPTIMTWLNELPPGLFPVGRLDAATTGLLLLADDGDLAHLLLDPRYHAEKEYHLWVVGGHITHDDPRLETLRRGLELDDGPASARTAEPMESDGLNTHLRVVITEGRNRLVRRMARGAGFVLLSLHRHRIGDLVLGPMAAGEVRRLTAAEYDGLWAPWGGRDAVRRAQLQALRRRAERMTEQGRPYGRLNAWLETLDAMGDQAS